MLAVLEPLEELADYQEIVQKRGKTEGILQIPANRRMCEFTEDTSCESTERWL